MKTIELTDAEATMIENILGHEISAAEAYAERHKDCAHHLTDPGRAEFETQLASARTVLAKMADPEAVIARVQAEREARDKKRADYAAAEAQKATAAAEGFLAELTAILAPAAGNA